MQSFTIEIGQAQLYKCIVKKLSIHDEEERVLRTYIESKNYAALSNFIGEEMDDRCDETVRLLEKLPKAIWKFRSY